MSRIRTIAMLSLIGTSIGASLAGNHITGVLWVVVAALLSINWTLEDKL